MDSDSELEDSGEPRTHLTKQGSETSTEEVNFCDEGSEGLRSRSCSVGQSDAEGSARCCSPGEEQSDLEEQAESRDGSNQPGTSATTRDGTSQPGTSATPRDGTSQPGTSRGHGSHELQPRLI